MFRMLPLLAALLLLPAGASFAQDDLSQLLQRLDRIEQALDTNTSPLSVTAEVQPVPQAMFGANGKIDARKAILEAARQELRPLQVAQLRLAMALRPVKTQAAIDIVEMRLQAEGLMTEDGDIAAAVDWNQILAIFLELLPIILKLFGL